MFHKICKGVTTYSRDRRILDVISDFISYICVILQPLMGGNIVTLSYKIQDVPVRLFKAHCDIIKWSRCQKITKEAPKPVNV